MKFLFLLLTWNFFSVLTEEVTEFTQSNNLFTASVYKEILKGSQSNFLVSPLSAETVLTLAQSGARGDTLEELRTALHLPSNQEKIESDVKSLLPTLKDEEYAFHVANKIYVKQGHHVKEDFEKIATDVFSAEVENIDFASSDAAAQKINKWVEEHTEKKIQELVSSDSLNDDTRAILINALYFQGNWSQPFAPIATKRRNFYENEKSTIRVFTMHNFIGNYSYSENSELDAKLLEISFKGQDASMTFILPNHIEGLTSVETQLDKVFAPQTFTSEAVSVALPKFRIESKLNLKTILKNLGVDKAFSPLDADFSGISDEKIFIDEVIQKTFVIVGEEGVEAAAATEVEMSTRSGHLLPPQGVKQFIADHPFLFYIRVKGVIIFAGRVLSPKL